MNMIYKIAKTELQMLFYSPVAWLVLIIFTFQSGMIFSGMIEMIEREQAMGYDTIFISASLFNRLFYNIQDYLFLYIPLLTMGLVSRDLAGGTIKLLHSSPMTNSQIILGKFLSMMIFALLLVGIFVVYVIYSLCVVENFDLCYVLTGILGIYLLICTYASIGLFMSTISSYQIIAAVGTFVLLTFLNFVSGIWQDIDFVRDITYWLAINGRAQEFINGLICSEDVLYFVIVVCLFLALTIIRLNSVRQKIRFVITLGRNIGVIFLACFLGYLSALPQMKLYHDATSTKMNTLTPNSQDIVAKLDGGMTITTYINALDPGASWYAAPYFLKPDMERFEQYLRFKPDMKLKYVYYYDTTANPMLDRRFPNATLREKMVEVCKIYGLDSNKFMAPEEIRKIIDLSGENNTFVRQIVRENGEKAWLRIYNDMQRFPSEKEISAAFKRMVMDLPKVGFVEGHGERSYSGGKDRDYSAFANDKGFRYALENQGFDVAKVTMDQQVPEDINIIVISDMREWFTPEQEANLQQYIDRGGNLFILGEPKRRDVMNNLFAKFGYEMTTGVLVKRDTNLQADVILSYPTKEADSIAYDFGAMRSRRMVITTPSTAGLEQIADKGYTVTNMFKTDTIGVWNELETTDFIDDTVRLNPAIGEVEKIYNTVVALSRKVGNKEQKIILTGDADCISNGEFGRRVPGVRTANFSLITGSFFWMSDNEVPIDVRRPALPDNKVYVEKTGSKVIKWSFMIILPLLLAGIGIFLWIRRKGR